MLATSRGLAFEEAGSRGSVSFTGGDLVEKAGGYLSMFASVVPTMT